MAKNSFVAEVTFNNQPLASWVTHITRSFLIYYSCLYYSSILWLSSFHGNSYKKLVYSFLENDGIYRILWCHNTFFIRIIWYLPHYFTTILKWRRRKMHWCEPLERTIILWRMDLLGASLDGVNPFVPNAPFFHPLNWNNIKMKWHFS